MANWQRELNLLPEWTTALEPGGVSIQELSQLIADRLNALSAFSDYPDLEAVKEELVERFAGAALDETLTKEEFDYNMTDLYDWADTSLDGKWNGKKACWVRVF